MNEMKNLDTESAVPIQDPNSLLTQTASAVAPMTLAPSLPSRFSMDVVSDLPDDSWSDVFKRWIPLPSTPFSSAAIVGQELSKFAVWEILSTSAPVLNQLSLYSLFGFDALKFRVVWTTPQFARGALLFAFYPSSVKNDDLTFVYDQEFTAILTPSSPSVELTVPITAPTGVYDLTTPLFLSAGLYRVVCLAPFVDDSTGVGSSYTVEMQVVNPRLGGHRVVATNPVFSGLGGLNNITIPTILADYQSDRESDRKSNSNSLSSTLNNFSTFGAKLGSVATPLQPVFQATALGLEGAAKVAKFFGFDKPNLATPPHATTTIPNRDMFAGSGMFEATPHTLNPVSTTSTSVVPFGGSDDDAALLKIIQRPSYLTSFNIAYTDLAYTPIVHWPVSPQPLRMAATSPNVLATVPHCGFVAMNYANWRGTMRYTFRIFGSPYTKARLAIVWSPVSGIAPTDRLALGRRTFIDVTGDMTVPVDVPYMHAAPYLSTRLRYPTSAADSVQTANGVLYVYLVNPLSVTGNLTPSPLRVLVTVQGGADLRFAGVSSPLGAGKIGIAGVPTLQGPTLNDLVADDNIESALDFGHRFSYIGPIGSTVDGTRAIVLPNPSPRHHFLLSKFLYWRGNIVYRTIVTNAAGTSPTSMARVQYVAPASEVYPDTLMHIDQAQTTTSSLSIEYDQPEPMVPTPFNTDGYFTARVLPRYVLYTSLSEAAPKGYVYMAWGDRFAVSRIMPSPTLTIIP